MPEEQGASLKEDARHLGGAIAGAVVTVRRASGEIFGKRETPNNPDIRFEHSDVHSRAILFTGVGLLVGLCLVISVLYIYFSFLARMHTRSSPPPLAYRSGDTRPPKPRLQQSPRTDMHEMNALNDNILSHYQWVDRRQGLIGIPIVRAMALIVERGIPAQKTPPNIVLSKPAEGTRLTGLEEKVEPAPR